MHFSKQTKPERCRNNNEHLASNPIFFCLDPDCQHQRLLCPLCVQQEKHKCHKIAYISDKIDPFSRLVANAYAPQALEKHNSLHQKAVNLDNTLESIQGQVNSIFCSIRKKLIEPIYTLAGTFSAQMIQDALNTIQNKPDQLELIEAIAQKINYLIQHQQNPTELSRFDTLEREANKTLKQTGEYVKMLLKDMLTSFDSVDKLENSSKIPKFSHFRGFRNKDTNQLTVPKISEQQMQILLKLQGVTHNYANIKQQFIQPAAIDHKQAVIPNAAEVSKKIKPRKNKLKEESKQKKSVFDGNALKRAPSSIIQNTDRKKKLFEDSIMPSEIGTVKQNESSHLMQPESENSSMSTEEWIVSPLTPLSSLSPSKFKYIKTLRVDILQSEPKQLLTKLRKMTKLETLIVFDALMVDQHNVQEFVKYLPKSIKKISLNCANDFNRQCIQIMVEKGLNKIEVLEYYYDIQNHLRQFDENLFFRFTEEGEQGVRIEPMQFESANYLAQCFPNLKSCWIKAKKVKPGKKTIYINYGQLESLVIGQIQESSSSKITAEPISPYISSAILGTQNLRSLAILGLRFDPTFFSDLVSKNGNLQTLLLQLCVGVKEQILVKLTSNPMSKLKNFSIKECTEIRGSFIQNVPKAEVFIMDHAIEKIQGSSLPFSSFENCNSLIHFNLFGQAFMTDGLLQSLKNSKGLKYLNIGCTCITDACVPHFANFPELTTLVLDENTISAKAIYDICAQLPKLEKLSICGFNGKKKKGQISVALLRQLGVELPMLKHLSIRGCCQIGVGFDLANFPSLKAVEFDNTVGDNLISTLRCAGIKLIQEVEYEN